MYMDLPCSSTRISDCLNGLGRARAQLNKGARNSVAVKNSDRIFSITPSVHISTTRHCRNARPNASERITLKFWRRNTKVARDDSYPRHQDNVPPTRGAAQNPSEAL